MNFTLEHARLHLWECGHLVHRQWWRMRCALHACECASAPGTQGPWQGRAALRGGIRWAVHSGRLIFTIRGGTHVNVQLGTHLRQR